VTYWLIECVNVVIAVQIVEKVVSCREDHLTKHTLKRVKQLASLWRVALRQQSGPTKARG
jgi:hypothetical protein